MREVGIFEAKTHLSRLLDEIESGGEVVITRHGTPVARIIRAEQRHSADKIERRRRAIAELRAMARKRGTQASHAEIKAWIEDHRR